MFATHTTRVFSLSVLVLPTAGCRRLETKVQRFHHCLYLQRFASKITPRDRILKCSIRIFKRVETVKRHDITQRHQVHQCSCRVCSRKSQYGELLIGEFNTLLTYLRRMQSGRLPQLFTSVTGENDGTIVRAEQEREQAAAEIGKGTTLQT